MKEMALETVRQNSSLQTAQTRPMDVPDYEAVGIPLQHAAWHFAGRKLRRKYQEAEIAGNRLLSERTSADAPGMVTMSDVIFGCLDTLSNAYSPHHDVMLEMWDRIFAGVCSGKLVALGYEMPRKAGDRPVKIPVDVFQRWYVKVGKAEVKGAGLWFVSVRIANARDLTPLQRLTIPPSVSESAASGDSSTKLGRPSAEKATRLAYEKATASGRINFAASLKGENTNEINRFITHNNLWHEELSHETIRRHIGKDFNAMRQNTKQ